MRCHFRYIFPAFLLCLFCLSAPAQKRIYLAPDDHTDYMWTADEATYRQAFLDTLDYYLNQADATANNPAQFQSRWNCDGNYWMWTYEQNRSSADFNRLISRIRDGHISVPLTTLVSVYGGSPAEAVLRSMYYPGRIERRYGLRFTLADAMENQTLPLGLGSLFAGAGARYSWRGVCGCVTQVPDLENRQNEIYWWTGRDSSRVLLKWNSLFPQHGSQSYNNQGIGGYAEARFPGEVVDFVDGDANFRARYPYSIIGAFGQGWDDLETMNQNIVQAAQTKSNANRQVLVSNEEDFFRDFEANYGANLPSVAASFGNEWELGIASMNEVASIVKRSVEKLRSAEALATLVSLQNASFMSSRTAARDSAFENLGLFYEHNWVANGGPGVSASDRAAWERRTADNIKNYVDNLQADAASALGSLIANRSGNQRFYVFNPLSETRTDIADFPYNGSASAHVVDLSTGSEAPSQIVTIDGVQYLRVLAQNVPSVGYKVFEIQTGAGANFGNAATVSGNTIENSQYRITVNNSGAITSLYDKTRGREFARRIGGRYINDFGGSGGSLAVENAGAVSVTLLATSNDPLAHTSRITLIRDARRIEIRNDINQNFGDIRKWSFSFNLDSPDVWHEEVGAVLRARLTGDGGHYSPRNARYDWLTFNHFADMTGAGNVGVTVSNADCHFFQLGSSTPANLDTATPQINALAGGQIDGFGISGQNGDAHFLQRFAIQTHDGFSQTDAMRFALEHQNPLVTGAVTGNSSSPYPETNYSLLSISDPNVLLWALKPAEEGIGQGVIARVWNQTDSSRSFSISLARNIKAAKQTTHIETDVQDVSVGGSNESLLESLLNLFSSEPSNALLAQAGAQQMQTFRLLVDTSAPTPTPTATPTPTPTSTPTPTPTVTPTPTPGGVVVKINAGGGAAEDFSSDFDFANGNTAATSAAIDTGGVTNPAPQAVYQTERYGAFSYQIGNLTPAASYHVRLHFAEIYWGADGSNAVGKRVMNITINGALSLANFDVFAMAGGANRAVVREFDVLADSAGRIKIDFAASPTSVDKGAKVSGIEIYPNSINVGAPTLLTLAGSSRAVALDAETFVSEPFSFSNSSNFSADGRTRVMLFAVGIASNQSSLAAQIVDAQGRAYPATIEYVGAVPNFASITQINIKLPDGLASQHGDVTVFVNAGGVESNRAVFALR
jgi:alpha-mannosidase